MPLTTRRAPDLDVAASAPMRGPPPISSARLSAQRPVSKWVTGYPKICGEDALFALATHPNAAKHLRSAGRRCRSLCTYAWATSDKLGEAVCSKAGLEVGHWVPQNMWRGRTFWPRHPPKCRSPLDELPT